MPSASAPSEEPGSSAPNHAAPVLEDDSGWIPGALPALLFEMLGTLVEPPLFRSHPEALSHHLAKELDVEVRPFQDWWNETREERSRQFFDKALEGISAYVARESGTRDVRQLERAVRRAVAASTDGPTRFVEGVEDALDTLRERGYAIAVLENMDSIEERTIVGLSMPSSVDQLHLSTSTGLLLPEDKAYKFALRSLWEARPERSAFVGSGWHGALEGARRSGLKQAFFVRGPRARAGLLSAEEEERARGSADATLDSVVELLERFR